MNIKLKTGIDNLKFGMTRKEVINELGDPTNIMTDEDEENEIILEYFDKKFKLTFYQSENDRFGYFRSKNKELSFEGKRIINEPIKKVKNEIFKNINEWEFDDYGSFQTFFNEENWMTLHVEYGEVYEIELGVTMDENDEYQWPK